MRKKLIMSMRTRLSVTFLLALVLLALGGKAMSDLDQQSIDESKLQSVDRETKQLLMILRDEQLREREPSRVVEAIERLGEMRSASAIVDLIRLLTFRRTFEWESQSKDVVVEIQPIHIGNRFPATSALSQIGKPALPALIEVIETQEVGSIATENAIYTVAQIFRDVPSEGVEYLKEAAAKASSTQAAQHLLGAAEKMKRFMQQ